MKHRVTIGKDNKLYGLMEDLHEEGETVTFSFYYRTDTNYHVTSSQVRINCEGPQPDGKLLYSFIMPDCDVIVDIDWENSMTALPSTLRKMKKLGRSKNDLIRAIRKDNKEYCPECGYHFTEPMKFCPECGHKMYQES